ncbi:hypothetical protein ACFQZZ_14940 [Nocardia sp. GCM10030253]|uniref:hypothetical protein n=1 Tax=Nocardia sp. GCM10030253 TaxID=3273404 RepID=UPI00362C1368
MSKYLDPDGERHGIPTWPWRLAPQHLRTWRQLRREGQRPGGAYEGQVLRGSGTTRKAYLYDAESAVPIRVSTDAQLEALQLARWTRSALAAERRGIDASDMREVIEQARADITARRAQSRDQGRERSR